MDGHVTCSDAGNATDCEVVARPNPETATDIVLATEFMTTVIVDHEPAGKSGVRITDPGDSSEIPMWETSMNPNSEAQPISGSLLPDEGELIQCRPVAESTRMEHHLSEQMGVEDEGISSKLTV